MASNCRKAQIRIMKRIHYVKPSITSVEREMVDRAMNDGWGQNAGSYVREFELAFARKIGAKFAVATSSCTGALHLGMSACGIGPGDEVILADTNWVATAAPIVHLGAIPVFVDITKDSWCIDPDKIEEKVTPATKAIIATHLYGNLCDIDKLRQIATKYNLLIIEDSAEALGSYYFSKHVGTLGNFGVFSFHGSKTITTGEGGMLVTDDSNIYEMVTALNNHGRKRNEQKQFWPSYVGYKFKMSDLQAALGLAQLTRFDELIHKKRQILEFYRLITSKIDGLTINPEVEGTISGAWMPNVVFSKDLNISISKIQKQFISKNIDARVFFWPLSSTGLFGKKVENINSYDIPTRSINLPSYHEITIEDLEYVGKVLKSCLK